MAAFIAVAATFVGGAIEFIGQLDEQARARETLFFKEQVNQENKANAEADLKLVEIEIGRNQRKQDIMSRKLRGSQVAAFGASGVTVGGSALDVLRESVSMASMAQEDILIAGERAKTPLRRQIRSSELLSERINLALERGADADEIANIGSFLNVVKSTVTAGAGSGTF